MKWKHTYKCNDEGFPFKNYIAFKFTVGGKEYGDYEEGFLLTEKFRMLRSLVLNKQKLVSAFYEELDFYTNLAKYNPTDQSIAELKELADAIQKKQDKG